LPTPLYCLTASSRQRKNHDQNQAAERPGKVSCEIAVMEPTEGSAKAFIADLVPAERRGTAYGLYNAAIGLMAFPASAIAGLLWQGAFGWHGLGAPAPFFFGAGLALLAGLLFWGLVQTGQ
jgi:MFS family permease